MVDLKSYFHDKYQGGESFVENVILPIFGDDKYDDAYEEEVLENNPELTKMAASVGISQILRLGTINIPMNPTDVFDITVSNHVQMERNRVSIQLLIRRIMSTYSSAFMVFHYENDTRWDWRFTFCSKQGSNQDSTDSKRYTFLLGPNQSCRTAAENFRKLAEKQGEIELDDIVKAFDVESLSKEFFEKYKAQYEKFCTYIYNNKYDETKFGPFFASCEDKIIRDYVKKLLGRLVFLQFLQKKGWLGGKSNQWNDGDPDFLQHLYEYATPAQKANFLDEVLEPLFQDALDANRPATNHDFDTGVEGFRSCKIPYLNGGLFGKDAGIDDAKSVFPAEYFHDLLTFFYQYNFTIDENDPNDAQVGIDPEMLGRIFENLLEDNKDKGAFYTPKPIVQYMCKESLIAFLQNGCSTDRAKDAARAFVETHDAAPLRELHMEANGKKTDGSVLDFFDKMLKTVKICDPAIGSGAFPMGLLRELYACRSAIEDFETTTPAEIKKEIIQNNIYGVDIEKGAVDIARLRFWLSLILDEEDPKALPNLDFKIMQGNSLLESFHGVDLSNIAVGTQKVSKALKVNARTMQSSIFFQDEQEAMKEIQQCIRRYYSTDSHSAKQMLYAKIENATRQYLYHLTEGRPELQAEVENLPLCNDQFFLWHTFFADVFEQGGFDIVIGNPPYIPLQDNDGLLSQLYAKEGFETFNSGGDIYCLFYEHGYNLLRNNGVLAYITSCQWLMAGYGKETRKFLAENTNPTVLIDFTGLKIFETATVDTNIILFRKSQNTGNTQAVRMKGQDKKVLTSLSTFVQEKASECEFLSSDEWIVQGKEEASLKKKIKKIGTSLKEIGVVINRGLLTGFNDAFIISKEIRDSIINSCLDDEEVKRTENLIRPVLRGRDVRKWGCIYANLYLINTHNGIRGKKPRIDINDYPATKDWLDQHYEKLLKRTDKGETPYNLRNCAYVEDLMRPKIVYPETTVRRSEFFYDESGMLLDKTTFFIVGENLIYLQGILTSRLIEWYLEKELRQLGKRTIQYSKQWMENVPIVIADEAKQFQIITLVDRILAAKKANPRANTSADEQEIDRLVYDLYGLTEDEIKIVEGTN